MLYKIKKINLKVKYQLTITIDDLLSPYNALTQLDPHNICTILYDNEDRWRSITLPQALKVDYRLKMVISVPNISHVNLDKVWNLRVCAFLHSNSSKLAYEPSSHIYIHSHINNCQVWIWVAALHKLILQKI